MSQFFKNDQPIVITRNGDGDDAASKARKGKNKNLLAGQFIDDYPARRKTKKDSLIRIFDLGSKPTSLFYAPPLQLNESDNVFANFNPAAMKAKHLQILADLLQGLSDPDFKDQFDEINKKSSFADDVRINYGSGDDDNKLIKDLPPDIWTEKGIKIAQDKLQYFSASSELSLLSNMFLFFQAGFEIFYKVTGTLDQNAPEITFEPAEKMEIYMPPTINSGTTATNYLDGLVVYNPPPSNPDYRADVTRAQSISGASFTPLRRNILQAFQAIESSSLPNYQKFYQTAQLMKSIQGHQSRTRLIRLNPDGSYTTSLVTRSEPFGGTYHPTSTESGDHADLSHFASIGALFESTALQPLMAVVKKGNQPYFFWIRSL